jgi:hypothetical protein
MDWTGTDSGILRMSGDVNLGFDVVSDNMREFAEALQAMTSESVMAGFPADEKPREDEDGNPTPITNAAIAYVQNTGMPELNIPAREFMVSGIEAVETKIVNGMETTGIAALDGDRDAMQAGLHAVGMTAKLGIQNKIVDGPFEALKESTLRARARKGGEIGKAAQFELDSRAAGNAPDPENARPLNVTGQMRNAVNYVLRKEPS